MLRGKTTAMGKGHDLRSKIRAPLFKPAPSAAGAASNVGLVPSKHIVNLPPVLQDPTVSNLDRDWRYYLDYCKCWTLLALRS